MEVMEAQEQKETYLGALTSAPRLKAGEKRESAEQEQMSMDTCR